MEGSAPVGIDEAAAERCPSGGLSSGKRATENQAHLSDNTLYASQTIF